MSLEHWYFHVYITLGHFRPHYTYIYIYMKSRDNGHFTNIFRNLSTTIDFINYNVVCYKINGTTTMIVQQCINS